MNSFLLEIITPERVFIKEQVQALVCQGLDGEFCIEKGHQLMVAVLKIGQLRFLIDGKWREASNSEGFMEVHPDHVVAFVQTCEWPEEIDAARAERDKEQALEELRHKESISEHKRSEITLARAMARLKLKQQIK